MGAANFAHARFVGCFLFIWFQVILVLWRGFERCQWAVCKEENNTNELGKVTTKDRRQARPAFCSIPPDLVIFWWWLSRFFLKLLCRDTLTSIRFGARAQGNHPRTAHGFLDLLIATEINCRLARCSSESHLVQFHLFQILGTWVYSDLTNSHPVDTGFADMV